jgi:glycosyltransferase involved in cell wall biosynthesis
MGTLRYVLVTPARNEERYIGLTLDSVIGQTRRPVKWVVVSDGSTDRTDEIVASRLRKNPWMDFVRMPSTGTAISRQRSSASTPGSPG